MVVAVQQPQRENKRDLLDTILAGVQVASNIYGIKVNSDKVDLLKQQQEESQRLAAEKAGREKEAFDLAKEETARKARGELTPIEAATLATKGLQRVDPGTKGAIEGFSMQLPQGQEGAPQPIAFKAAEKEGGGINPYQQQMLAYKELEYQRSIAKDEEQRVKIKNEMKRQVGDTILKTGLADVKSSLDTIDKLINIDGTSDIAGVGQTAALPDRSISQEGRNVRQAVGGLRNMILKARSGGAVTPQEAERLLEEIGIGVFKSDADLRNGLANVRKTLYDKLRILEAPPPQEVFTEWRDNPKSVTTEDDLFRSIRVGQTFDDLISQELQRRTEEGQTAGR